MRKIGAMAVIAVFSLFVACGVSFAGAVDGAIDGIDTEMEQVRQSFEDSMVDQKSGGDSGLITEDGDDFVSPPAKKAGSGGSSCAADKGVLIK